MKKPEAIWLVISAAMLGLTLTYGEARPRADESGSSWFKWDEECPDVTKRKIRCAEGGGDQCTATYCT